MTGYEKRYEVPWKWTVMAKHQKFAIIFTDYLSNIRPRLTAYTNIKAEIVMRRDIACQSRNLAGKLRFRYRVLP